jgi:hypothetical protein
VAGAWVGLAAEACVGWAPDPDDVGAGAVGLAAGAALQAAMIGAAAAKAAIDFSSRRRVRGELLTRTDSFYACLQGKAHRTSQRSTGNRAER